MEETKEEEEEEEEVRALQLALLEPLRNVIL